MIIDTSALVAILLEEDEGDGLLEAIVEAEAARMSAANYLECGIVTDRRSSPATRRRFDELLRVLEVEVAAVTFAQARVAREAYRDFGRGSRSRAGLNFGDCFAYALAAETGEELLFKGEDFAATDVFAAPY